MISSTLLKFSINKSQFSFKNIPKLLVRYLTYCLLFSSASAFASIILQLDDPDSPSYIQMTIQDADLSDYIFLKPTTNILPGDFNYFDGESLYTNSGIMTNESTWIPDFGGGVDFRGDYFQDSIGFSIDNMWLYDEWGDLDGKNINGHNYSTYLSGQSFVINMNAGQPVASSSAWVISVDPTVVPVPAAAWLFGSALAGLGVLRRRK